MAATDKDQAKYALLRMWIETGALHYKQWKETGTWPEGKPTTKQLVESVLGYLPSTAISMSKEEIAICVKWDAEHPEAEGHVPPELRRGDVVFRDTPHLIEALNDIFPEVADAVKSKAPEADSWGLEPWAVALAAGGALAAIGKVAVTWSALTPVGAIVAVVAGILLLAAAAAYGLSVKTPEGKNIVRAAIDAAGDGLKEVGKKASMLVTGLIVAATVAVGVGVTVAIIRASPKRRARSLYASRRTAAIEADESDDE